MRSRPVLLLPFLIFAISSMAQPATYLCQKPSDEIIIDGNLNEWKNVVWTDDFIEITGDPDKAPAQRTRAKMMWDSNYLYIAAEMEENHLWATITERDQVMYVDNDFEVFIDPDGDTHNYAEIEVNAFGTVWDLFLTRPYRDGTTPLNSYNIEGLLLAVKIQGSINDPSDIDSGWVLEMAIPWNALIDMTPGKRKPYPGEYWRINFSRVQWDLDIENGEYIKKNAPENNWVWSEQGSVNMHMPEKWGYVFFSEEEVGEGMINSPPLPEDEKIRSSLRELYFQQKDFHRMHRTYSNEIEQLDSLGAFSKIPDGDLSIDASGSQFLIRYYPGYGVNTWFIDQHGKIWKEKPINAWIWMHGDNKLTNEEWVERFKMLRSNGVSGVLLGGSDELLEKVIPLATQEKILIQTWRWILNCNDKEVIENHPEWYSVSREGYSCLEKQPYVGYYKWLCPSRPEVADYLMGKFSKTLKIDGLFGYHLDYIRHCDVILPRALWEKYGLYQDHEMPEYDYCYCEVCRSKFKDKHGYDPLEIEHPELDTNWRQYRYDIVSDIVKEYSNEMFFWDTWVQLSAAVFPSPDIARKLVRQDWDSWRVSAVFPMIYHSFYNEDIDWIGETTWAGVHALNNHAFLYTGLYIPALSPEELNLAIKKAIDAGANGISLFDYNAITEEHWKIVKIRMSAYK